MARILMPLPARDFDPSESGIPWRILSARGHDIVFATPDGTPAEADARMVTGAGLGILAPALRADRNGRAAYDAMTKSARFRAPLSWSAIVGQDFDALLLPGGHAKGMIPYLESTLLQALVASCFAADKPIAAICHGVLLAARSKAASGNSVLHGRRTTALLRRQELLAWNMTKLYLDDYYRTYPTPVEEEVRAALARPEDFETGPMAVARDTPERPDGFVVIDGHYISSRWPGDAHAFSLAFADLLSAAPASLDHSSL